VIVSHDLVSEDEADRVRAIREVVVGGVVREEENRFARLRVELDRTSLVAVRIDWAAFFTGSEIWTNPPSSRNATSSADRDSARGRIRRPARQRSRVRSTPTHSTATAPGITTCRCDTSLRPRAERNEARPKSAIRNTARRAGSRSRRAAISRSEANGLRQSMREMPSDRTSAATHTAGTA
jgi:hypothetical protein